MFLTRADVSRLTGRKRFRAMARALDRIRIRYKLAATGEPLVRQDDLDGKPRRANSEPNWGRIGSVRTLRP